MMCHPVGVCDNSLDVSGANRPPTSVAHPLITRRDGKSPKRFSVAIRNAEPCRTALIARRGRCSDMFDITLSEHDTSCLQTTTGSHPGRSGVNGVMLQRVSLTSVGLSSLAGSAGTHPSWMPAVPTSKHY